MIDAKIFYDSETDTTVRCVYNKAFVNISFPGTNSFRDVINIFSAWYTDVGYGRKVSNGLIRSVDSVWTKIKNWMPLQYDVHIKVSGHSLGGGLAQLTSMRLLEAGYKNVYLTVQGSVRVGNRAFMSWLESSVKMLDWQVYGNDVVPLVFPWMAEPSKINILKKRSFPWLDFNLTKGDHIKYWEEI